MHTSDLAIRLNHLSWPVITNELSSQGFASIASILQPDECASLVGLYAQEPHFRKIISMARHGFGQGEYKYFTYPLPTLVQTLREVIYPYLVPVANHWMQALKLPIRYPTSFAEWISLCQQHNQTKPTPLMLRYEAGGYNTLHQDLYGEVFFPFQSVVFLNKLAVDYSGGEFVLTEQRPRSQSKAQVLAPDQGDMVLFTTHFRPAKSAKGYYRAAMRHGVSPVRAGVRHTLGIIFHDAV